MAETPRTLMVNKASWDEMNVGIFLQLLVDEIDAGNRPSGQFTKQAWATVTSKFQELSGCKFTQTQLKNKWDNLKKDFATLEKLLHDESGLGYDYNIGRVIAEPAWWRQKIQERPEYKKFRTHGPLHLELQERVFRGQVATGYMEYIPENDIQETVREHEDPNQAANETVDIGVAEDGEIDGTNDNLPPTGVRSRAGNPPKRKRSRISSKNPSVGEVNSNMNELINKWHRQADSSSSVRLKPQQPDLTYDESLNLLSSLPWIDEDSQDYMDAMVLLEDPNKRVALRHIKDKPEQFVRRWIRKLQDEKNRRIF